MTRESATAIPASLPSTAVPRGSQQRTSWGGAVFLLAVTWLGVNAVWGLLGPRDTFVSVWLRAFLPLNQWVFLSLALLFVATVAAGWRRHSGLVTVASLLLAYLGGVLISEIIGRQVNLAETPLREMTGQLFPLLDRSVLLVPAIPMLGVLWMRRQSHLEHIFRVGTWTDPVASWSIGGRYPTWGLLLLGWLSLVALPAALLMQAQVGFAPFRSGTAWAALPALSALALLNGFTEELLFRGFIQSALVACLGRTKGVWLQAAFFGIHHWGASPGAAAGFPAMIFTVLLGALWGRSVLKTRGLGWAVVTHASIDLAFFLVQFVPDQ